MYSESETSFDFDNEARHDLWKQHGLQNEFLGYDPTKSDMAAQILKLVEDAQNMKPSYATGRTEQQYEQYRDSIATMRICKQAALEFVKGRLAAEADENPTEALQKLATAACIKRIPELEESLSESEERRSTAFEILSEMRDTIFSDVSSGYRPETDGQPIRPRLLT